MSVDINLIKTFIKTVESDSFSTAAKSMFVSKSAITKRISSLEEALGVQLYDRSNKKPLLTKNGKIFYSECKLPIAKLDDACNLVSNRKKCLKLRFPQTLDQCELFKEFMDEVRKQEIPCTIETVYGYNIGDLSEDNADMMLYIGEPNIRDSGYKYYDIGVMEVSLFASKSYLKNAKIITSIQDLKDHRFLAIKASLNNGYWKFTDRKTLESIRMIPHLSSDSHALRIEYAKKGLYLIDGMDFLVSDELKNGSLVKVLEDCVMEKRIYLVHKVDSEVVEYIGKIVKIGEKVFG